MATEIVIPMLGVTVENGKITEWLKNEGDPVEKGESIFVVEADKVTTEVESPASGILAKILLSAGEQVPVLTVVGVITAPGEDIPPEYGQAGKIIAAQREDDGSEPISRTRTEEAPVVSSREAGPVKIIPAARKLAQDNHLEIGSIQPTGPDGVITVADVKNTISAKPSVLQKASTLARRKAEADGISLENVEGSGVRGRVMLRDVKPAAAAGQVESTGVVSAAMADPMFGQTIPMDSMRQTIARRLSSSAFTAPHVAFYTNVCMDPLLSYRKSIVAPFEKRFGLRPSINDFLIKAVALTIREFPMLNSRLDEDEIRVLPNINIGLAVAVPNGLVVPAITDADHHGLSEIARQRNDLVPRALEGRLTTEEMDRGTFTVSSLAQFDVTYFTSILNPPQSGILSVGKTREALALEDGEVMARRIATMGITVDHRIVDGAMAAGFIERLKSKLETPAFTFMHS